MKAVVLVFIGLFLAALSAQAAPSPIDSLRLQQLLTEYRQEQLAKRMDSLANGMLRLSRTNDSLNKELYYYRAKDDFYVMAVDRQGSQFMWFVGGALTIALALVGIFSYAFIWKKIEDLKKEFSNNMLKIKNIADRMNYRLHRQSAFSYSITSNMLRVFYAMIQEPSDLSTAQIKLSEANESIRAYLSVDADDIGEINEVLTDAKRVLIELTDSIDVLYEGERLKFPHAKVMEIFNHSEDRSIISLSDSISMIKDGSLKNLVMAGLVKINNLREKANSPDGSPQAETTEETN